MIRQGHTVKAVSNGAEALKTMNGYGFLLSDIRMPGIDGVSLARCVARNYPHLATLL
ncbi:MAG: response regulator [Alphaproteobacteria bacterium]